MKDFCRKPLELVDSFINKIDREKLWSIFLVYVMLNPVLDLIYGFTKYIGVDISLNINHIIRVLVIPLLFLLIRNSKNRIIVFAYTLWIMLCTIVSKTNGISINIVTDISWDLKMLTALCIFLLISECAKEPWFDEKKLFKMLIISALISCVSIIISITGFGYVTYNYKWGYKGFFYINNTPSIYLLMIYPMFHLILNGKKKIIYSIICLLGLLTVGTKTTMLGGIVLTAIMLLIELIYSKRLKLLWKNRRKTVIIFGTVILAFFIVCTVVCIIYLHNVFLERSAGYQGSIWKYIISNRDIQLETLNTRVKWLPSAFRIIGTIFGYGYSRVSYELQKGSQFVAVEMDLHGTYYMFGIIVFILLIYILLITAYRLIKLIILDRSKVSITLFLIFVVGLGHGIMAGHVLYEALTLTPFWIVCGYANYLYIANKGISKKRERCEK